MAQICLGRYGGDEFVVLLPNTQLAGALEKAEHLRAQVLQLNLKPDLSLSCSFGVAQAEHTDDFSDLFSRADAGLYLAKERGRNQVASNE